MIKANELRIGNYITEVTASEDFYASVISIGVDTCIYGIGYWAFFDKLAPIPLTEKWLLDFGFENGFSELLFTNSDGDSFYIEDLPKSARKYVHQFQNIIFALTGEELTLKT